MSKIQWTDETWNPTRGCSLVSAGCTNCYAMRQAHRFSGPGQPYEGLTRMTSSGPVWTGEVTLAGDVLTKPLHWKSPRRIFVNSMSDLFHENLSYESIIRVFDVMRRCPQHTFQILTKRPERLYDFCSRLRFNPIGGDLWTVSMEEREIIGRSFVPLMTHCWFGVSVENQQTADERIPWLLRTPAAIRWVSYEPALGPVNFDKWLCRCPVRCDPDSGQFMCSEIGYVDWIVVGGESGLGARPFNVQWARDTIAQCKAAGVACFVKQLGSRPVDSVYGFSPKLKDKKGGDWSEWPEDLRVREYPNEAKEPAYA